MTETAPVITEIPHGKLTPGKETNAREGGGRDGLDELAALISAKGLLQPLIVRPMDGGRHEITAGNRRHAAIGRLIKDGRWPKARAVPCIVRNEDDAEALETSLVENTARLPLHPVDQHAVFARLAEAGTAPAEIATRFGIAEKTVRKHLALGKLAPEIRAAWKKGKLTEKAAQAFTLHPDQAVQLSVFEKVKGRSGIIEDYRVRQELETDRVAVDDSAELELVGLAAYEAAGGTIAESLFDEDRFVADVALVKKLARDRLAAECKRLKKEGWSWAIVALDDDDEGAHHYGWERIEHEEGAPWSAKDKKRSGCIVGLDSYEGKLEIEEGVVKPDGKGRKSGDQADIEDELGDDAGDPGPLPSAGAMVDEDDPDDEPATAGPYTIPRTLEETIEVARTAAAGAVVATDPPLALRLLLAALGARDTSAPLKITAVGHGVVNGRVRDGTFADHLDRVMRTGGSLASLAADLAPLVAEGLDLVPTRTGYSFHPPASRRAAEALRDALPGAAYLAEVRAAFLAADYFARARKETALAALQELEDAGLLKGGQMPAPGAKKAAIAEVAAAQATAHGWLPPELRHPEYSLGGQPAKKRKR